MVTMTWRATHIILDTNTTHRVIFKNDVTASTWARFHKLIVNRPGLRATAHSMTAVVKTK